MMPNHHNQPDSAFNTAKIAPSFDTKQPWWNPDWTVPALFVALTVSVLGNLAQFIDSAAEPARTQLKVKESLSRARLDTVKLDAVTSDLAVAKKFIAAKDGIIETQARLLNAQGDFNAELVARNKLLEEADQSMAALNKDECSRRFGKTSDKPKLERRTLGGPGWSVDVMVPVPVKTALPPFAVQDDGMCRLDRDGVMRDPKCLPTSGPR